MDFINVEITNITHHDFEIFETVANEYYEDFPLIKYSWERIKGDLNYTFNISYTATQKKQNKGSIIRVETTFKFLASDQIPNPFDEETIRAFCDLFYVAWINTVVMMNLLCCGGIFRDNYLSKRSIREFYDFLKEN